MVICLRERESVGSKASVLDLRASNRDFTVEQLVFLDESLLKLQTAKRPVLEA